MTASITTQHEKIKSFDWEPSYFHRDALYPTKYKIPSRTKDPFRTPGARVRGHGGGKRQPPIWCARRCVEPDEQLGSGRAAFHGGLEAGPGLRRLR